MRDSWLVVAFASLVLAFGPQFVWAAEFWEASCDSVEAMSDRFLRSRWTDRQVASVVACLKERCDLGDLPFLRKFPWECSFAESFDLRGINLRVAADLTGHKVELPHAHLEKSFLQGLHLQDAVFWDAHFQDAELNTSDLSGAWCHNADFARVRAYSVNFQNAILFMCNFHGATLVGGNFQSADLNSADFEGALLVEADFSGADLTHARFKNTFLDNARLDRAHCRYIDWDGYYIGEETNADLMAEALKEGDAHRADVRYRRDFQEVFGYSRRNPPLVREDIMTQDYVRAKLTYRYLKNIYRSYDLREIAGEFHYRENCVATELSSRPVSWLVRKLLFEWTYGYRSRPWRLLWSSVAVIVLFGLGFLVMSFVRIRSGVYRVDATTDAPTRIAINSLKDIPHALGNSFYFSLLTFVTFGYGTITPQQWVRLLRLEEVEVKPVRWARIAAALESLCGIYLLALFAKVILGG